MAIHTAYSVRVNSTYAASTRSRAVLPASELKARSRRRPDLSPTSFLPAAGWINRSSACRHGHARVLPARPPGCHHHLPIHAVRCDLPLRFRECGGSTWSSCCPARRGRTHDQGRGRAGTGMAIPSPPVRQYKRPTGSRKRTRCGRSRDHRRRPAGTTAGPASRRAGRDRQIPNGLQPAPPTRSARSRTSARARKYPPGVQETVSHRTGTEVKACAPSAATRPPGRRSRRAGRSPFRRAPSRPG